MTKSEVLFHIQKFTAFRFALMMSSVAVRDGLRLKFTLNLTQTDFTQFCTQKFCLFSYLELEQIKMKEEVIFFWLMCSCQYLMVCYSYIQFSRLWCEGSHITQVIRKTKIKLFCLFLLNHTILNVVMSKA